MIERVLRWISPRARAPRDALGLVALRVMVGVIGLVSALRFLHYGWVDELFVAPRFHFTYVFAPFVRPLGSTGMHAVFWILALAGALVALGALYRVAIVTFALVLTYVQAIDVTNYLNHYYLLSLLTLLMATMPLGDVHGVDGWVKRRLGRGPVRTTVPAWCYTVLRFQVGVVYTFAGLAKVTEDWLVHGQPLSIWLASRTSLPLVGPLLAEPWAPHLLGWMGCFFDLTIVWWLRSARTRPYAFAAVLVFHALTRYLFPIGMFPFIMVAAATVFFDEGWPRRLAGPLRRALPPADLAARAPATTRAFGLAVLLFAVHAVVQIAVPLRAFFYPGDVHWHEQGMRFSWRVMVREKNAAVTFFVDDVERGRTFEVRPRAYLDDRQEREMGSQPDLVLQLAHHVARDQSSRLGRPVRVRAEVLASLNGRRMAPLVDSSIDLTTVDDGLAAATWILPSPGGKPPFLHATR